MPLPNPNLFKKDQSYDPVYGGLGFGGEEECITQRPTSTALFCVSAADRNATVEQTRNNTGSPYRFTITKNESLLNGFFTRLSLTEIRFPWTLPNLSKATFTDKIGIRCGSDTSVIDLLSTFPEPITGSTINLEGLFVSPPELAKIIMDKWNSTYPANPIVMDIDDEMSFRLYSAATSAPNPVAAAATKLVAVYPLTPATAVLGGTLPANTYQLFDMMNWVTADTVGAAGFTVSGTGENLLWTDYVDIVANNLTYNQALKDSSSAVVTRDIIYRIYLTDGQSAFNFPSFYPLYNSTDANGAPLQYVGALSQGSRPFLIYRQFQSPKEIRWNKNQPIGQCTFEVYDDKGRCLADLFPPRATTYANGQGSDWHMTLLVSEN
jgi:hypothetical protein